MTVRRRLAAAALAAVAGTAGLRVTSAEDPAEAAARKRKIEAAKREAAAAEKAFVLRVNTAIDRGAAWLPTQQAPSGLWPSVSEGSFDADVGRLGVQALCLLTLVKCGAGEGDPAVKTGLAAWRARYEKNRAAGQLRTYDVGVSLMLLDALYGAVEPPKDVRYAAPKKRKCRYPKDMEEIARTLVDFLVEKRNVDALGWRYPQPAAEGPVDLSATQYAMLGLYAASRCGFEAPANLYEAVTDYCLKNQAADGPQVERWVENPAWQPGVEDRYGPFLVGGKDRARGWAYLPGLEAWTGSMTTAGIAALAIAKDRLRAKGRLDPERARQIDHALIDGIAWLSANFAVDKNPGGAGGWHFYYLYGLERVGALTGLARIGKHDWYREGAEHLVGTQAVDGGWTVGTSDLSGNHETRIVQTCFALLFLRRATVPPTQPIGPPALTGG